MRYNATLGWIMFLLAASAHGQIVYFVDAETGSPVPDVTVYTPDYRKSALSAVDGGCDLSSFTSSEKLIIKHIGYLPVYTTKAQLLRRGRKVYLDPGSEMLQEVVMTASPFQQQKKNVPQKVAGITREQIRLGQPQTSADLLEQTGQVFVQKSQLGGGSPMIRGFATNRLLITVDGIRMNHAIFRAGNIQNIISIDPLNLSSAEVIFGPASVIYGSDALGGAQNFITRNPRVSPTDSLYLEASGLVRVSTANDELALHADWNLGKSSWAWYGGLTVQNLGDLRMGRNGSDELLRPSFVRRIAGVDSLVPNPDPLVQVPTGFQLYHVLNKFRWEAGKRTTADVGLHFSTSSDYDRYDRLIRPGREPGTLRSAEWYYGPQQWMLGYGRVTHLPRRGNLDQFRFTAAYQRADESRHSRDFGQSVRNSNNERVHAYSMQFDTEWNRREPLTWFAGAEWVHNTVASTGSFLDIESGERGRIATRYPDGSTWSTAGAYIQLEYERNPRLTWLGGLRYTRFWLSSTFSQEFYSFPFEQARLDNGALTGNLGFTWRATPGFRLSSHLSTGFRAPNVDDIGKLFDPEPGFVLVPNPELEPEYVYTWESGFGIDLSAAVTLEGTGFFSYLDQAIIRRESTLNGSPTLVFNGEENGIISLQNSAFARVYGFEASLRAGLTDQWSARFNISKAWGTETDEGGEVSPSRHVPPLFGDLHLIRRSDRSLLDLFLAFNGTVPFERLALSERNKDFIYQTDQNGNPHAPGWYTLNARFNLAIGGGFSTTLIAENLLDARYRGYSSGIAAPGRNLILSLQWNL